jgi:uncharacterized protein DUF932
MKEQQTTLSAHATALHRVLKRYEDNWTPSPKWLVTSEGIREITGKYITKEQETMNNSLMLHCGSTRVTRDELENVLTPRPTASWKPVPHSQVAELVVAETVNRGYEIVSEEYGLNPMGTKMFGVLKFHPNGHPEHTRCIGFRNSHDKSMALGITAGLNVLVCDNLCFGGETTFHRKHTSGIEVEELIPRAFENLSHQFIRLEHNVDGLKIQSITISTAKLLTVKAAELKVIPSCDILTILDEFRNPRHEEFAEHNRWSLYNSFTENAKKYSPARADRCYRGLSKMFALV